LTKRLIHPPSSCASQQRPALDTRLLEMPPVLSVTQAESAAHACLSSIIDCNQGALSAPQIQRFFG